jgi:Flp pilus assembly pilin Flp
MTKSYFQPESGQTMAEYAVLLGVITIATVGAFGSLANAAEALIDAVLTAVSALP